MIYFSVYTKKAKCLQCEQQINNNKSLKIGEIKQTNKRKENKKREKKLKRMQKEKKVRRVREKKRVYSNRRGGGGGSKISSSDWSLTYMPLDGD